MEFEECPIYLINLKEKENFLLRSLKELRKLELFDNIMIKEAVGKNDIKKIKHKYITQRANNNINNKFESLNILPTLGSIGCAISHMNCWKDIIKKKFNYAIICEDDIKVENIDNFKFNYYKSLNYIIQESPIFITFNSKIDFDYEYSEEISKVYTSFTGTSFYMINLKCCYELLKMFPITEQIDLEISKNYSIEKYFFKNRCLNYYDHISSVQYYFLELKELIEIFQKILPEEMIEKIYSYLPQKKYYTNKNVINYGYDYQINYGYNYNYNPN
jgi:GR25 family glycosyltransferase involved in LPS biosynthesis